MRPVVAAALTCAALDAVEAMCGAGAAVAAGLILAAVVGFAWRRPRLS